MGGMYQPGAIHGVDAEWEHIEIGFQEFIRQYGIWCRGSPQDRLYLLWRLFTSDEQSGQVSSIAIERLLKSMFDAFLLKPWTIMDTASQEFQIHAELLQLYLRDEASLAIVKNEYFSKIANNAIETYHKDGVPGDDFLWRREFDQWVITMPGICQQLCVPDPVKPSPILFPSWGRSPVNDYNYNTQSPNNFKNAGNYYQPMTGNLNSNHQNNVGNYNPQAGNHSNPNQMVQNYNPQFNQQQLMASNYSSHQALSPGNY
eukprot:GHVL01040820.1.p1 GENE.GHVL01040820.1~~GHVL01040820.1.p1  ORF type:complete len:258 (-),score=31.11 GHVL01040820.1:1485-2258(-)